MNDSASHAGSLAPALLWGLITTFALILTILFGGFVLIRIFRRRAKMQKDDASKPTEHVDAWQLHKLPEDTEDG